MKWDTDSTLIENGYVGRDRGSGARGLGQVGYEGFWRKIGGDGGQMRWGRGQKIGIWGGSTQK